MKAKRYITHLVVGAAFAAILLPAEAQVLRRGFGGALRGAAFGALVGDEDAARKGAIIGGSVGAVRGIAQASREQAEREAYARQEAERQRIAQEQQQAEIERLKAQQAAQAAQAAQTVQPSVPAPAGPDATVVIEIQKSLIRLGFNPGPVDGKLTPATVNAIKQYQTKMGLIEDGHPSQPLLAHMLKNGG